MTPDGWERKKLGTFAHIKQGKYLSKSEMYPKQSEENSVPVIGANGVIGWGNKPTYFEPTALVTCRGNGCGLVQWTTGPTHVSNNAMAIYPKGDDDRRFLRYLLESQSFDDVITGSAQPQITRAHLENKNFLVPPPDEQRLIVGILETFDSLIDTNNQLISAGLELADAVASLPYTKFEIKTFGEIAKVSGGGTPSTKVPGYWGGEIAWATPTDFTALPSPYLLGTSRMITKEGLRACSSPLISEHAVLMTSRATIGAIAFNEIPTAFNQGFIAVEPFDDEDRYFLFHELRRRVTEFISRSNGSTFRELPRGVFKSMKVMWPSRADRIKLAELLRPIHEAGASLQQETNALIETKKVIQGLLISGQIEVNEKKAIF